MGYLLYGLIAGIFSVVIYLAFKAIGRGMEAKSRLKEDAETTNDKQEDTFLKNFEDQKNEKIFEKLKEKNLSAEDLKKMYDEIQKKN